MSSLKNASKSNQKVHRERNQLESRQHLGFLEKKKDYKTRAKDYQKKQQVLKVLKRKALNRNPDEFYFHMINSAVEDDVHHEKPKAEEFTDDQMKLMQTQDLNYINYKRSIEGKKICRLQSDLHLLDAEDRSPNKHTIFVDSKKEAKGLDLATYFNTHPSMLGRSYNRPRLDTLKKTILTDCDDETLEEVAKQRKKKYNELQRRIERECELTLLSRKMFLRKQIANKKEGVKKIKDGTTTEAPIYLWKKERKR